MRATLWLTNMRTHKKDMHANKQTSARAHTHTLSHTRAKNLRLTPLRGLRPALFDVTVVEANCTNLNSPNKWAAGGSKSMSGLGVGGPGYAGGRGKGNT